MDPAVEEGLEWAERNLEPGLGPGQPQRLGGWWQLFLKGQLGWGRAGAAVERGPEDKAWAETAMWMWFTSLRSSGESSGSDSKGRHHR